MITVLQVHQCYRQSGGEEHVVQREAQLLNSEHVLVLPWHITPDIAGLWGKINLLRHLFHNRRVCDRLQMLKELQHIDLIHLHNGFPYMSPGFLQQASALKLPVIMTLHNFRLLVPSGMLMHPLKKPVKTMDLIQLSLSGRFKQSVGHATLISTLIKFAQWRGWVDNISAFICPSQFVREQFIVAGWPAQKLHVIPHFCWPMAQSPTTAGEYALVVGRDDPIKGISWLVSHWHDMPLPLKVVGLSQPEDAPAGVTFCGYVEGEQLKALYQNAAIVIVPSQVCETFCNVVMEAFSAGKPCLVANHGALVEWVTPGVNGDHFAANNVVELKQKLRELLHSPLRLEQMGLNAFTFWQAHFSPERHQQQLITLYAEVLKDRY